MKKRKLSFPEYHHLEQAVMLIERVCEYRQNLLSDYGYSVSIVDNLVALESEHNLRSLYEAKNLLLDLLPKRSKIDIKGFDERCVERANLREKLRNREKEKS